MAGRMRRCLCAWLALAVRALRVLWQNGAQPCPEAVNSRAAVAKDKASFV
jgi:hypothetical protein